MTSSLSLLLLSHLFAYVSSESSVVSLQAVAVVLTISGHVLLHAWWPPSIQQQLSSFVLLYLSLWDSLSGFIEQCGLSTIIRWDVQVSWNLVLWKLWRFLDSLISTYYKIVEQLLSWTSLQYLPFGSWFLWLVVSYFVYSWTNTITTASRIGYCPK